MGVPNTKPKRVSNFGNIEMINKNCINEPINLKFSNDTTAKTINVPFNVLPKNSTMNISFDFVPLLKPPNCTIFEIKKTLPNLTKISALKLSLKDGFFYINVGRKDGSTFETMIGKFCMGNTEGKAADGTKTSGQNITLTPPVPFLKFNFEIRLFSEKVWPLSPPKMLIVVTGKSEELPDQTYFIDVTSKQLRDILHFDEYDREVVFEPDVGSVNIENFCVQDETKPDGNPVEITDFRIVDETGNLQYANVC